MRRIGTLSPAEYAPRRRIPADADSLSAAAVRMTPRIGPMHGVQPNPKASPMMKGGGRVAGRDVRLEVHVAAEEWNAFHADQHCKPE